jgi:tagatose 1,6-diphosphate aldolase
MTINPLLNPLVFQQPYDLILGADMSHLSITRLFGLGLTPGKLRGLQRISHPNGTLTMVALDQNSSMINMMKDANKKKGLDREPGYEEIVEAKLDLCRSFGAQGSAVLIDAYYGAANFITTGAIGRNTGLLVRIEKSGGPKNSVGAPITELEPGLSVAKIKRLGADAVKLLAPFEPDEFDSAEKQFAFVEQIYSECKKHDILLLLEPVSFPFTQSGQKEDKKSKTYLDRKARAVIEGARILSGLCDVFKAEFPGTLGHEPDGKLQENLHALDEASKTPWVLLSAGVDFPDYKKQVEMAVKAGASGVLGGRAFWKEYFTFATREESQKFARNEGAGRVKQIQEIVMSQAKPWFARYGLTAQNFETIRATEGWHFRYGGTETAVAKAATAAGEVY